MNHLINILAIDPGASGGVAELYAGGKVTAETMPDDADMCELVALFALASKIEGIRAVCYMELVGGFIKGNPAPGSAMFKFGNGYGYVRGLLAANRIEVHLVRPQTWQVGIPGVAGVKEQPARKRALKEHAARLYPALKVTLATADALCIAAYARHDLMRAAPVEAVT
jgi:hypothetical protein